MEFPTTTKLTEKPRRLRNCLTREENQQRYSGSFGWWRHHLQCQDFLQNEHAIQYRGLACVDVRKSFFLPDARPLGLEVSFRHWMRQLPTAPKQKHRRSLLTRNPGKMIVSKHTSAFGCVTWPGHGRPPSTRVTINAAATSSSFRFPYPGAR